MDALGGNAAIMVGRDTSQVRLTGTARRVGEYAAVYAERKRRLRNAWRGSLDARFLTLLALARDARQRDLQTNVRHKPRDGATVLDELFELERRGLVRRAEGGTGYRRAVTDAGSVAREDGVTPT